MHRINAVAEIHASQRTSRSEAGVESQAEQAIHAEREQRVSARKAVRARKNGVEKRLGTLPVKLHFQNYFEYLRASQRDRDQPCAVAIAFQEEEAPPRRGDTDDDGLRAK